MASPQKDPRTGILYLNIRIPADLRERLRGRLVTLPVGDAMQPVRIGAQVVKVSLATRDPNEGRIRFAAANAALLAFWEAQRHGPKPLTHKQRVALAGEVRQRVTAAYDDNPGSVEMWRGVIRVNDYIKNGAGEVPDKQTGEAMTPETLAEARYGSALDSLLSERMILLDPADRAPLIAAVARAMEEAAEVNLRRADGDYGPDDGATKYPALDVPVPSSAPGVRSGWTFTRAIDEEVERRSKGRDAKPLRVNTVRKYQRVAASILAHRGSDDIATLTTREVNAWVGAMQAEGSVSNKTISDRMTSLKTIVSYARKLSHGEILPDANPVSLALVPESAAKAPGLFTLTMAEARTILKAARKETRAECRWVPWLLAYSGARVNEVAPLRPSDFRQIEGRWFFTIGAGGSQTVKTAGSVRTVPVHRDLIAEGLLAFLEGKPETRLFPARTTENVGKMVKVALGGTREGLKPNHGWRHLFEDRCIGSGMSDRALTYITGRASGSSADSYGRSEARLPGLAREMDKVPGYL